MKKDTIYLVPHAHFDALWVFTKEEHLYINLMLVLRTVAELIDQVDFRFVIEQTYLLEEMEKRCPELFSRISDAIKAGKIEIADGEYLMADTMLPDGETLIREILTGKRYAKQRFGVDVPVMWQADSFGLNAQLPQIYKKAGYRYVAFRRGVPERKPSEFLWEGLDGTRILAHWMPLGYRAGLDLNMAKLEESYKELKELAATSHILMPSGDEVTLPQPDMPDAVRAWNEEKGDVAVMKIATPGEFFEAMEKEAEEANLEVRKGEMYSGRYSRVFPSCSSSRMWLKLGLCNYECWLLRCERWATVAYLLRGFYPFDDLLGCWQKILFSAFHDVIPGTGMDRGYEEIRQYMGYLRTTLFALTPRIFNTILAEEATDDGEPGDIVVFNPLSWEASTWVEMEMYFERGRVVTIGGLKSGGEEIDVELIKFAKHDDDSLRYAKIGFVATVPAMGYKVYRILERKPRHRQWNYILMRGNTIENRFFSVEVDPATGLIDVTSRSGKRICRGNELVLEEETGDLYYHRQRLDIPLKTESGEGVVYGAFRVDNFWVNKSPLRRVINIETNYFSLRWPYRLTDKLEPRLWRHKFLECKKKIIIYRDIPRIDFITFIEDKHPRARLRIRFRTDMRVRDYACGSQFGVVNRPTDHGRSEDAEDWVEPPSGIYPSLKWLDYSDGNKGVTVIHRGIPENEIRDGDIYLTLLRSVSVLSSDGTSGPAIPVMDAQELKKYVFRYSIYPHDGDWRAAASYRRALEFNCDMDAMQLPRGIKLPRKCSFIEIKPANVILAALKRAEDERGVILRFYETQGNVTDAEITLFRAPKTVKVVNLLEEPEPDTRELKITGRRIELTVKPFEIVSLRLIL